MRLVVGGLLNKPVYFTRVHPRYYQVITRHPLLIISTISLQLSHGASDWELGTINKLITVHFGGKRLHLALKFFERAKFCHKSGGVQQMNLIHQVEKQSSQQ